MANQLHGDLMAASTRTAQATFACLVLLLTLVGACGSSFEFNGDLVETEEAPQLFGTNWNGEPFDLATLEGDVVVVFFGYTFCPDVCPMTLHKMTQLREKLGSSGADLQVVFASVDPHRDTVEKLSQYVPNFAQDFYGVHLDFDQLETAKDSFALTVQYGQPKDGPGTDSYYYVDHTGNYFILDRSGTLRLKYPPNATVDLMWPDIEHLLGS